MGAGIGCTSKEVIATRQLQIAQIDIGFVRDGQYQGDYSYGNFTYVVGVSVKDHKIVAIDILKNRTTKHAKNAEAVVQRILEQQRNDVDAISGATTTSKALLKAIENALAKGQPLK
jgi:uncharacterized protein with FMN-binding domain